MRYKNLLENVKTIKTIMHFFSIHNSFTCLYLKSSQLYEFNIYTTPCHSFFLIYVVTMIYRHYIMRDHDDFNNLQTQGAGYTLTKEKKEVRNNQLDPNIGYF